MLLDWSSLKWVEVYRVGCFLLTVHRRAPDLFKDLKIDSLPT